MYRVYLKKIKKYNLYTCSNKCAHVKNKKTCLIKYGVEHHLNNKLIFNKQRKTNIERYGVENPFQNEEIKNKIKKGNLKKYGVEYISQNEDILIKQQKSAFQRKYHKETELSYQGSYEKHFLDYCFNNNINIKKGKRIEYFIGNKKHYYFSDFYYEPMNLIIEIKSNWTYNKELDINITKQKSTIDSGYNYLFIIDKNYEDFKKLIS